VASKSVPGTELLYRLHNMQLVAVITLNIGFKNATG